MHDLLLCAYFGLCAVLGVASLIGLYRAWRETQAAQHRLDQSVANHITTREH